jgi:shikimate kinase
VNVLLMGLRGSGKTTIGRLLAEALDLDFIDLDEHVLGGFAEDTVAEVWASRGEPAWREAEAGELDRALDGDGRVIALGGGTPMIETAAARIVAERRAGRAVTVYLRCDPLELARRMTRDPGDRPPLRGADAVEEIGDVLADREPAYRRLADVEHDVTATTPRQATAALAARIDEGGGIRRG